MARAQQRYSHLTKQKPPRAKVTDAEFRFRLKNIDEWRKKRLAKPYTKDSR